MIRTIFNKKPDKYKNLIHPDTLHYIKPYPVFYEFYVTLSFHYIKYNKI